MNLKETAALLGWKGEEIEIAIQEGIETPFKGRRVLIAATKQRSGYDISDEALDAFLSEFESEAPGRYPPVAIRRELMIESQYKCSICRSDAPLRFHHIVEWAKLRHHDARHMLAICGTCHDKIGLGQIDTKAQKAFKAKLCPGVTAVPLDVTFVTLPHPRTPQTFLESFPELTAADVQLLEVACALLFEESDSATELASERVFEHFERTKTSGLTEEAFAESIDVLNNRGYIHGATAVGGTIPFFGVSSHVFGEYLRRIIDGYDQLLRQVALEIAVCNETKSDIIAVKLSRKEIYVTHILDLMQTDSLVRFEKLFQGPRVITRVSAELRRRARQL